MRIVGISCNGGTQESVFYSNTNRGRSRDRKTSFQGRTEAYMVDIINMNVNLMEVDKETLKEEEVVKVVMKVIEINNQITT
jgi:hypothetical protein